MMTLLLKQIVEVPLSSVAVNVKSKHLDIWALGEELTTKSLKKQIFVSFHLQITESVVNNIVSTEII